MRLFNQFVSSQYYMMTLIFHKALTVTIRQRSIL